MTFGRTKRGPRGLVRGALLLLVAALVAVAVFWVVRSPAAPKGELQSATPGLDAHVSRTPQTVVLDFGRLPASAGQATVTVVGPDDQDLARGAVSMTDTSVTQRVEAPRRAGAYQVSYRLVATDGHATSGHYWFWFAPSSTHWASRTWSAAYAVIGLMALAALVLALVRSRTGGQPEPLVPVVPGQRTRDNHEGTSAPSRSKHLAERPTGEHSSRHRRP